MKKIKVMAIAPYNGLRELISKVAKSYSDRIEVTSAVGDLFQGSQMAKTAEKEGYDIIISRGGTAEMIKKTVTIPVINIEVSGYDYMRAIKVTENIPGPHAVIGFSNIIEGARNASNLLNTNIKMFTVQSKEEIAPLLRTLSRDGYGLIIGDVATVNRARDMNMNTVLLTSGEESVGAAFESAIEVYSEIHRFRRESSLFQTVIAESIHHMAGFTKERELLFKNFEFEEMGLQEEDLYGYFDNIIHTGRQDIILQKGLTVISICGKLLNIDNDYQALAFYIDYDNQGTRENTKGITFRNAKYQSAGLSDSFRKTGIYDKKTIETANSFCKTSLPVLITGDIGVGKSRIAYAIHRCSEGGQKPFVSVDCSVAPPESWERLIVGDKNTASLIEGATICYEDIDAMPLNWQGRLAAMLENPDISDKYRFIATSTASISNLTEKSEFNEELYIFFSGLFLKLPKMKQQAKKIKDPVNVFIIEANTRFGKQVLGIEDEAFALLERYPWRYNFRELKQVVGQLVLTSTKPYISADEVRALLEARSEKTSVQIEGFELDGTLEEIENRVIKRVLELENGNYSNTATRLGIGRSTLWRKLNKSKE